MCLQAEAAGGRIDDFAYCPHLPDASVAEYRTECDCRKPRPGLVRRLLQAQGVEPHRAIMIGDRDRDVQAGEGAGVRGLLYAGGDLLAFVQAAILPSSTSPPV
jgi:D-glycero-D-manno-heptose 1,7-bisphosphate phosphatase